MNARLLLVLALLLLAGFSPRASAQGCTGNECTYANEGAAYGGCISMAQAAAGVVLGNGMTFRNPKCVKPSSQARYRCEVDRHNANGTVNTPNAGCNLANMFEWHVYPPDKQCSAQGALQNMWYRGDGETCSGGCLYAVDLGAGINNRVVKMGSGPTMITRVGRMTPTGGICTVGEGVVAAEPQTTEQCQQQGTLTQCLTADGRTCTVGRSGRKYCWEPGEAGIKASGNEGATKAPEGTSIKPPPKAPSNGGDWQQGGTGTVSVTSGGTTNNYNTTNWNSSYGGQGSGANGGGADGQGNGGSGDGSGEGEGEGDDGWGEPGQGVGDLYEGTDKTIGGLMGNFFNQAKSAPVMQGVTNFMGVTSGGGQCPVFTVPATQFWDSMTFDGHCGGTWLQLLMACGWVALALSAYFAVRIAVT